MYRPDRGILLRDVTDDGGVDFRIGGGKRGDFGEAAGDLKMVEYYKWIQTNKPGAPGPR